MAERGILSLNDRTELIEGEILHMSPIGSRHAACVNRLTAILTNLLNNQAIVSVQNPIQLSHFSEPEPDVALLAPRADFYATHLPTPADVLMVMEVADTSIEYDRTVKLPLYARSGIPEVWIINLNTNRIEIYTQPAIGEYEIKKEFTASDTLQFHTLAGLAIKASDILG